MSLSASPTDRPAELDVVELEVASGRWAAGTVGTIVEREGDLALIEIADDRGHALEFVEMPVGYLKSHR